MAMNDRVTLRPWYKAVARPLLACIGAVLVAACASAPAPEDRAKVEEDLATILSQPLDGEAYGEPRRCISSFSARDYSAIGNRFLVFDGPGDTLWLNELRGHCPGLSSGSALAFRQQGTQLCELDRFKVTDLFVWPRYQRWPWEWLEGIPCTLGRFQPVSSQQVEALRAALR